MKTVRLNKKEDASKKQSLPPLAVMSALLNRINLGNQMGTQSYDGDRNITTALGYKTSLTFSDYLARYFRQDIAKAVIDRPVKASWKGDIEVIENTKTKRTKFEKEWRKLYVKLKLKSVFMRADKLTGLGSYSVILLGLDDIKSKKGFENKVKKGAKLVYVKPFSEESAVIDKWDENERSSRFGKPLYYKIKVSSQGLNPTVTTKQAKSTSYTDTFLVHYSRVVHLTEDILEDEVYGIPRLQVVFDRLMDLEKLIGGDAEMFWRGARPGYTGNVTPDYEMSTEMRESLEDQIKDFEHNLKRVLVNEGIDYKSLEQQIADPTSHVDIQIQMISAVTGIPKRILVGSERGELSSAQDKQEWISYVTSRREEQNEPGILRPFIDHLLEYKIITLHKADEYTIVWDKLFSLSDKEKVELGKNRAIALKEYATNPAAQYMFPLPIFMKYFIGMDDNQISSIEEYNNEHREKELTIEEIAELGAKARQMERTTSNDSRTESGANKKKKAA